MSMNIYPFQEPAAFALCGEAAKLIWKQVADEDDEFNTDELSDLWCDLFDARWSNSFCGEIESLFPELTKNPLEQSYDDEELTVIPCDREPKLFEAAYATTRKSFWRNSRTSWRMPASRCRRTSTGGATS